MAAAIAFVLGLVVGSFLNVCIWRLPRHESLLWPPSHCPACGVRLLWRDNIPLLSFLLLRGRCRRCGVRIPWFYPVVECLTALAFSACIDRFGLTAEAAKWIVFCCLLIVLSFTDLQRRLLPDRVNFFGLAAGLLFSLIVELHDDAGGWLFAAIFHHPFLCDSRQWPTPAWALSSAAVSSGSLPKATSACVAEKVWDWATSK